MLNNINYVQLPDTSPELRWETLTAEEQNYLTQVKAKGICLKHLLISEDKVDLNRLMAVEGFKAYVKWDIENQPIINCSSFFFGTYTAQSSFFNTYIHNIGGLIHD